MHSRGAAPVAARIGLFLAVALAVLHGATALGKALDLHGFARVLGTYQLLPAAIVPPVALGLVALEFAIAGLLLLPHTRRLAALAAAGLASVFLVGLTVTMARGIALENCGCFGIFLARPLTGWTLLEDGLVVVAALFAARLSP